MVVRPCIGQALRRRHRRMLIKLKQPHDYFRRLISLTVMRGAVFPPKSIQDFQPLGAVGRITESQFQLKELLPENNNQSSQEAHMALGRSN